MIEGQSWRCDVCGRERPDEKIDVARHTCTSASGVTVQHNVKYCNDSETCARIARVRNHTDLWCRKLQEERNGLESALREMGEKLVWQRSVFALAAFIAGFVIRGGL